MDDPATEQDARQGEKTPIEMNPKMLHDIQLVLSRLVEKASQLLCNATTNLAESWMHIRSKFDRGKVINRSQSGSWEYRCMGAGLQQNMGKQWGPTVWSKMTDSSPNRIFIDTAKHSTKKAENDRKRKATEYAKKQRRRSKYSRTDDTIAARRAYSRHDDTILPDVTDDVSPEFLQELKMGYYQTKVVVTKDEAEKIERSTREQASSEVWKSERRKRLTASKVAAIAKMRKTTKRSKKVQELLYSTFRGNEATQYGMQMEDITQKDYISYHQHTGNHSLTVQKCGLFVSPATPWLAASPDGLVYDPVNAVQPFGLVEFKNPHSARAKTLDEACDSTTFCLEKEERGAYKLKKRHDYHYQIQCQLYCTNREWCDFVMRTDRVLHIERIYRDRVWWDEQLLKLEKFYFNALLPELACPRYLKGGIREPTDC